MVNGADQDNDILLEVTDATFIGERFSGAKMK